MENQLSSIPSDINKYSKLENRKKIKQDLLDLKENYKNSRIGQIIISKPLFDESIDYIEYLELECARLRRSL